MGQRKIGARILSIEEIKLILPTYEKLLEQLDEIQNDNDSGKEDPNNMQKTNNIAILGERGSGKTSVLKTIFKELNKRNSDSNKKKYIVLPIIVPENMSESSNLISTILGLFKGELDRIKKLHEQKKECGMGSKPTQIELEYSKLLKRFCYIQKEYRDVLVSEFTTENDYVKKSSEIFMSDIEFIETFNSFINSLVKDESYEKNPLIIFFIDDIDLSTIRCTDIVKTLLSYISNKNIVTFISGDLNTFEEALTIDFLRQEKVLDKDLFECSFLKNGGKLLERKKLLSYEYLKKIIPPVYRHTVKKWSLVDRGNYSIQEGDSEPIKLIDLLTSALSQFIDNSYFKYINFNGNEEKEMPIPQMLHIFDNTSRGLNNIYNVLLDTKEILTQEDDEKNQIDKFIAIKLLLETIVASNPALSGFRNELLGKVISFGVDFKTTVIRVDNFQTLFGFSGNDEADKPKPKFGFGLTAIQFSLFVFLDLSIRLLKQASVLDEYSYINTKTEAISGLINYPEISDSSVVINEHILKYTMDKTPKLIVEIGELNDKNKETETQKNIVKLLQDGSFPFAVTLYQYLLRYGYTFFDNNPTVTDFEYIACIYNVYLSTSKIDCEDIISVVSQDGSRLGEIFRQFSSLISPDELPNTIAAIFTDPILSEIFNDLISSEIFDDLILSEILTDLISSEDKSLQKIHFYKKIVIPLFVNFLAFNMKEKLFKGNRLIPLKEKSEEYLTFGEKNSEKNQVEILLSIDEKKLWGDDQVEIAKNYIKKKIESCINNLNIDKGKIEISSLQDSYNKFMNDTYKGVSYTNAVSLKAALNRLISKDILSDKETYLTLNEFNDAKEEIKELAENYRVWYGRPEARNMLHALDQARYAFFKDEDPGNEIKDYSKLLMWMHFYATYFAYNHNLEDIYLQSGKLAEFSDIIRQAENKDEADHIKSFIDTLNDGNIDKIDIDAFNALFK